MSIGTPYLVGSATGASAVTVSHATAAGDAIFVTASASSAVSGVTDTKGNTYVQLPSDTTNHDYLFASTYKGSTGTPTAALSTSDSISLSSGSGNIVAGGCSGLADAAADKTPAFASGSSTAPASNASGTLSQASELCVAAVGGPFPSGITVTWGSSFTLIGSALSSGNGASLAARAVSSTASVTATATLSTSSAWDCFLATFKAAAAPATQTGRGFFAFFPGA